jgi:arylsulfatase A-like enzyme
MNMSSLSFFFHKSGHKVLVLVVACLVLTGLILWNSLLKEGSQELDVERVIVIVVDTLRADHVSMYGYKRLTTPSLDTFAQEEASTFVTAYAASSWTLPSTVSLMTGLYPHQHGVEDRGEKLHPKVPTLAQAFSRAGYLTAAFVTHIYVSSLFGIDSGFDDFFELSIDWKFKEGKQLRAAELNKAVFPWLADNAKKPFFLYLHYFDPHWDYDAPDLFKNRFADPEYKGPADGTWRFISQFIPRGRRMPKEDLDHLRALYDGEIAYTDHQLGLLFAELKRLDMWDSSVVAVLSDHGEELQDHGSMHHIRTLYEEVLRVPLMIKLPEGRKQWQRKIISERVRTFDIGPTLLELAGVKIPTTFQSTSLLPLLQNSGSDRLVFARTRRHKSDSMTIIDGRHKLIVPFGQRKGSIELYNLDQDPNEKHSLAEHSGELVRKLGEKMVSMAKYNSRVLNLPGAAGGVTLTDQQKAHLKSLGYIE